VRKKAAGRWKENGEEKGKEGKEKKKKKRKKYGKNFKLENSKGEK
jgi:hypothetical protein